MSKKHRWKWTPADVSKQMTFVADNFEWRYGKSQSIADLQAEGVSFLWECLCRDNIALLADEVGLGKTFQALGVMHKLLQDKPDARVLIFVPRRQVADHWRSENTIFCKHHLHDGAKGEHAKPRLKLHPSNNFSDMCEAMGKVKQGEPILQVARTTWFSGLGGDAEHWDDKVEHAKFTAGQYREKIAQALNEHGCSTKLDLLIVDEAHYYRNRKNKSLRVEAASTFFSGLADKVLLLTATPNHSSNDDVNNIVHYFDSDLASLDNVELMKRITIRRLKKLGKEGKNKYSYRKENACGVIFHNVAEELFFGMYQYKLAESAHGGGERSIYHGYLEAFESFEESDAREKEGGQNKLEYDYHASNYKGILDALVSEYREVMGDRPLHPKYDKCSNLMIPKSIRTCDILPDKHVVFVRRIPSAGELANRITKQWDMLLLNELGVGRIRADRGRIERALSERLPDGVLGDGIDISDDSENEFEYSGRLSATYASKVLGYFREKTEGRLKWTVGSRIRARLRNHNSPFSLLFIPVEPSERICITDWFEDDNGKRANRDYFISGRNAFLGPAAPDANGLRKRRRVAKEYDTLWTLFWDYAGECGERIELERFWNDKWMTAKRRMALAQFVRAGLLFASPAPVLFLKTYMEGRVDSGRKINYRGYVRKLKKIFRGSLIYRQMAESLKIFKIFCEKQLTVTDEDSLLQHKWKFLKNSAPVYPYIGGTRNEGVLHAFNSPFFPFTLVGTSVLQEGLNLHRFCRKVMHYGMCWTPGDYEQRIGRVDRMQGLLERELDKDSSEGRLESLLPYLANSVDEDQVGNIIYKIRRVEQVIDRGMIVKFDKKVNSCLEESVGWCDLLLNPDDPSHSDCEEPYGYRSLW